MPPLQGFFSPQQESFLLQHNTRFCSMTFLLWTPTLRLRSRSRIVATVVGHNDRVQMVESA